MALTYIKLVLTAIFWGGTFIAGRSIAENVTPYNAAFIRFTIASVFLLFLTRRLEGGLPRLSRNQILPLILLGATGVFSYNLCFFTGLHYITAGRASLIIANNPVVITLLSVLIFREKLTWIKAAGILLSVTGAIVVISEGQVTGLFRHGFGKGELLICGCVASWAAYTLIGKSVMTKLPPVASVCYSSIVGAVLLGLTVVFGSGFAECAAYTVIDWGSLFYLGFFGTVLGFFWYYEGVNKVGPMKASVFINIVPVSAITFAFLILQEPLTSSLFTGGALVISGVYLTNAFR